MIEGVAFDLEGTVLSVEPYHFEAFRLVAMEVGVCFDPNNLVEDIASKIPNTIGGGDALISKGIWRLSNRKLSATEIHERKMDFYNSLIEELKSIEPRPGFLEVFEQIRRLGFEVTIASLTLPNQAKVLLEKSGVHTLFPEGRILLADSVENLKPAPDVYLKAAEIMRITPDQMIVFEDSPTGVMAAVAAECRAVIGMPIFTFKSNIEALEAAGAFKIFTSWEDVDILTLLNEVK